MVKDTNLKEVKSKIANLICSQVLNGAQSNFLGTQYDNEVKACGQFIIHDRSQRGIHGTSSAIRVLASHDETNCKNVLPQLIKYLENRVQIESELHPNSTSEFTDDDNNVIKISEELFCLSFVKQGLADTQELKKSLYNKLIAGKRNSKGWSYFISESENNSNTYELPTAFALSALYVNGYEESGVLQEFVDTIKLSSKSISDPTTFSIIVYCMYALIFNIQKGLSKQDRKSIVEGLCKSSFCIMEDNIEQNIEYWQENKHYYVRVPWQLYLIAITAQVRPIFFSKQKTQKILSSVTESFISNGEFKYNYSGKYLSTRTSAIVFETMQKIEENLDKKVLYAIWNLWDIFKKRAIQCLQVLVVLFMIYTIFNFFSSEEHWLEKLMQTAPDLILSVAFLLLNYKKKGR